MNRSTALSLAGNIIQFVDFGTKLFTDVGELYRSLAGSLTINDEKELVTTDLQVLIKKLRDSVIPETTSCLSIRQPGGNLSILL
jgi:hypothetical protein